MASFNLPPPPTINYNSKSTSGSYSHRFNSLHFAKMSDLSKVGEESAVTYDIWAETYDSRHNLNRALDRKALESQNFDWKDKRIVEFGCGTGRNTEWLLQKYKGIASLVGMDISDGMLAQARAKFENNPKVNFIKQDLIKRWPFEDQSVDFVFGNFILEHIIDIRPVFEEVKRVLAKGGKLFFCEFHPYAQYQGHKTRFLNPANKTEELSPPCYNHAVSDFINEAVKGDQLKVDRLDEWLDEQNLPRMLSINFTKL